MSNLKPKLLRNTAIACALAFSLMGFASNAAARENIVAKDAPSAEEVLQRLEQSIARAKSTSGAGEPALWTLSDDDTTIYIFGSFHLLRPDTKWQSPRIQKAFNAARKIYFEADATNPDAQVEIQALVQKYGMFKDGGSLMALLEEDDEAAIAATAKKVGLSMAQINTMKPWLVGLQFGIMQIMQSGYDPQAGVESYLTNKAKEDGKGIGYLETADIQLRILSGAPIEDQVEALLLISQTVDKGPEILDLLVEEWSDGDVQGLAVLMSDEGSFGKGYDDLIVKRNKSWVPQILDMLDEPGTVFVAVGAGHLAGPDSVITMLRHAGQTVVGP